MLRGSTALLTTTRRFFSTSVGKTIKGEKDVTLTDTAGTKVALDNIFANKKVVVIGVPGAFSGVCSTKHLPPFLTNSKKIKEKGVDDIIVVSVNDHFVMNAWANTLKAEDKVKLYADPTAKFTKLVGLDVDVSSSPFGNTRSKRYSLIVDNGKVTHENVEKALGDVDQASAEGVLKQLEKK